MFSRELIPVAVSWVFPVTGQGIRQGVDMKTDQLNGIDLARMPQPFVAGHPEYAELHQFAWRLAVRHIRETNGIRHMDTAWDPARNYQWVWDLSFVGLFCRYAADLVPALGAYDRFYQLQRNDGYISMTYDFTTGEEPWPNRINPPLFAWAEWEYYRTSGDASRLARSVVHIERLMQWIDTNRRAPFRRCRKFLMDKIPDVKDPDELLLYWFEDCGSSGMDDSPRTPRCAEAGRHFAWVDLCAQMVLSFRCLAAMHGALGNHDRAVAWSARAGQLTVQINQEMWCERTRFYHDKSFPVNFVGHKTAASFWTILAGICTGDRLTSMVGHLLDPREFNRPLPVPTLSADDANYTPEGVYWLGGVWAPTNYMITRGLMQAGQGDVAHTIAVRYLDGLWETYSSVEPHTLWESYSPERPEPGLAAYTRNRVKPDFVGWTGIGPIAMLIENVLGIDLDAPARRVTWDIRLTDEHGIRQFPVAPGKRAELICRARSSADQPARVQVLSDAPFELVVRCAGRVRSMQVEAGKSTSMDTGKE